MGEEFRRRDYAERLVQGSFRAPLDLELSIESGHCRGLLSRWHGPEHPHRRGQEPGGPREEGGQVKDGVSLLRSARPCPERLGIFRERDPARRPQSYFRVHKETSGKVAAESIGRHPCRTSWRFVEPRSKWWM